MDARHARQQGRTPAHALRRGTCRDRNIAGAYESPATAGSDARGVRSSDRQSPARSRARRDHERPRHPDRERRHAGAIHRRAVRAHLLGIRHASRRRRGAERKRRPPGLRAEQSRGRGQARLSRPGRTAHAHRLVRGGRPHVRAPREGGRFERPRAELVHPQRDPAQASRVAGAALPRLSHRQRGSALLEQGHHRRGDAGLLLCRRQALVHVRAIAHEERGGDPGRNARPSLPRRSTISTRSPTARTWRCACCSSRAT